MIEAIRRKIAITRSWFLEENAKSLSQAKHNLWYIFASVFILCFALFMLTCTTSTITSCLISLSTIISVAQISGLLSFFIITIIIFAAVLAEHNISSFNIYCDYLLESLFVYFARTSYIDFLVGFLAGYYLGLSVGLVLDGTYTVLLPYSLISTALIFLLLTLISPSENLEYLNAVHRNSDYNLHIIMTIFAIIVASCVSSLIF